MRYCTQRPQRRRLLDLNLGSRRHSDDHILPIRSTLHHPLPGMPIFGSKMFGPCSALLVGRTTPPKTVGPPRKCESSQRVERRIDDEIDRATTSPIPTIGGTLLALADLVGRGALATGSGAHCNDGLVEKGIFIDRG